MEPISKGRLLGYLNPVAWDEEDRFGEQPVGPFPKGSRRSRRVIDRDDLQQYVLPFFETVG